jgi:hypothetical protein
MRVIRTRAIIKIENCEQERDEEKRFFYRRTYAAAAY